MTSPCMSLRAERSNLPCPELRLLRRCAPRNDMRAGASQRPGVYSAHCRRCIYPAKASKTLRGKWNNPHADLASGAVS